jgi:hypothetical protein
MEVDFLPKVEERRKRRSVFTYVLYIYLMAIYWPTPDLGVQTGPRPRTPATGSINVRRWDKRPEVSQDVVERMRHRDNETTRRRDILTVPQGKCLSALSDLEARFRQRVWATARSLLNCTNTTTFTFTSLSRRVQLLTAVETDFNWHSPIQ